MSKKKRSAMDLLDDPQLRPLYEDTYTFPLDGIRFTIRCKMAQSYVWCHEPQSSPT